MKLESSRTWSWVHQLCDHAHLCMAEAATAVLDSVSQFEDNMLVHD